MIKISLQFLLQQINKQQQKMNNKSDYNSTQKGAVTSRKQAHLFHSYKIIIIIIIYYTAAKHFHLLVMLPVVLLLTTAAVSSKDCVR